MEHGSDCSIVICVEKGSLEYKALLLILTLRKNWPLWSSVPIYAYSPRAGKGPSDWLKAVYEQYDVRPIYEHLNIEYADYPLANKPIVMAHAERTVRSKFLVFLDTDILCWREPKYFRVFLINVICHCVWIRQKQSRRAAQETDTIRCGNVSMSWQGRGTNLM